MTHQLHPGLSPDLLLASYARGIFPMGSDENPRRVFWCDPDPRGIMPIEGFRPSRSLMRQARRGYLFSMNEDFDAVLAGCANRKITWITEPVAAAYRNLHRLGFAHSAEVRTADGSLVGGMYGVAIGRAFFGESMFSAATGGSKMALGAAISLLGAEGFTLFDTQYLTSHLASLGGIEVPRRTYRERLAKAVALPDKWQPPPGRRPVYGLLQRISQRS